MNERREPPRLSSHQAGAPASLRRAVRAAAGHRPTSRDVEKIALALGLPPSLPPSPPPWLEQSPPHAPLQVSAPHAAGSLARLPVLIAKATAVIGTSAALIWGGHRLWMSSRHVAPPAQIASSLQVAPPEPAPSQLRPAEPLPGVAVESLSPARSSAVGSGTSRQGRRHRTAVLVNPKVKTQAVSNGEPAGESLAAAPTSDGQESASVAVEPPLASPRPTPVVDEAPKQQASAELSEAQILSEARRVLASDPRRALAGVQRHQQLFPSGALVQEREILAIEALRRLGREAEANARAQNFRSRFPSSIHGRTFSPASAKEGAQSGSGARPSNQR